MTDSDLLKRFVSMGDDCEFGTTQAACNADCLDLLRWAGTDISTLVRLLDDKFAGIAEPGSLSVRYDAKADEHWIENTLYRFRWHTWVKGGEMSPERLLRRERARLTWQAGRLIEDLVDGKRILVRKARNDDELSRLDELIWHIRVYGPSHLLFVTRDRSRAGTVERVSPTLLYGFLPERADIESSTDVIAAEVSSWLPLCRQAAALADARSGVVP